MITLTVDDNPNVLQSVRDGLLRLDPNGTHRIAASGDEALEQEIRELALQQEDVQGVDLIHTRVFGNRIYVDIEISADGSMTLEASHGVAERVHDVIESSFPKVKHIMVHVNPAKKTQ